MTCAQEWAIILEKGRPLDKAIAGADTASLSYMLRDLLILPRVEAGTEMDDDAREQGGRFTRAPKPEPDEAPARRQEAPKERRWTDSERKGFCAGLRHVGITNPADFFDCTEAAGFGRPSGWSSEARKKALTQLGDKAGGVWDAWNGFQATINSTGREPGEEG